MEELITDEQLMRLNKSQEITNSVFPQTDTFASRLFESAVLLDKVYTPLLCLFGALGNALSLSVFCLDAKYGSQSSSFYLSALAVSDTGFLLNVFAVWLEGFFGGVITTDLSCPLVMYLGQVTCFMSVYFTVAFSIERYVAVHYPFSRPRICTRSKAKKVIAGITLLALLLFSYAWIIAKVVTFPVSGSSSSTHDKHLGHYGNFSASHHSEHSLNPTPNPFYVDKKSQGWSFEVDDDPRDEKESIWEESLEIYENEAEDTRSSTLHFARDPGDIVLFALPSSKRNVTNDDASAVGNEPYLNLNRQMEMSDDDNISNNSSSSDGRCICSVPEMYHRISEIANYIDSVLTLVLPFFLIAFFNARIAMTVWKLKDQRRNIIATATTNGIEPSSTSLCMENSYNDSNHHHHRRQSSLLCRSMENGSALFRNSSKRSTSNICCLVNLKNGKIFKGARLNEGNCDRGSGSTVRFHDNIEMSQIESSQGSSSLTVSHNLIQSSSMPSAATTPTNPGSSPRFCVVRRKKPVESSEVRVTKTLLLVSLVFVVLNLPAHAIRCAQFVQTLRGTRDGQEILFALQPWANLLFNTNFAVNFLLYCVSGRNFRNSLKNILLRKCQCRNQTRNMAPRFSWASDRSNKKFRNSCAATASTCLVPSSATLADAEEEDGVLLTTKKNGCSKKYIPSADGCRQEVGGGGGRFFRRNKHPEKNCQDGDDEECEEKEESTAMFLAYFSHESYLNYYDEDQDELNDGDAEEVASV